MVPWDIFSIGNFNVGSLRINGNPPTVTVAVYLLNTLHYGSLPQLLTLLFSPVFYSHLHLFSLSAPLSVCPSAGHFIQSFFRLLIFYAKINFYSCRRDNDCITRFFSGFPHFCHSPINQQPSLKGLFTKNWNFIHLLLTPMLMKALGTFSNSHNHSWLSLRKRIPPSERLLWPSTPTRKKTPKNNRRKSQHISILLARPHPIVWKKWQSSLSWHADINIMFLATISAVASYPGAMFMWLSQIWQVSLLEHALPTEHEHEHRIQNGCVDQKLS